MLLRAPPPNFPQALENDADDVVWALRTAGVQWSVGAPSEAIEWLLRAVEMSIDAGRIDRARDIQRNVNELNDAIRSGSVPPSSENGGSVAPLRRGKVSTLPPLPPPPGFEAFEAELLDVDMDVELEDEIESLEVLEPEVIDTEDDYDGTDRLDVEPSERLTAARYSATNDDTAAQLDDDDTAAQLDDDDIEALAEGAIEIDPASLRGEPLPRFARSEPPTAPVTSSERSSASLRRPRPFQRVHRRRTSLTIPRCRRPPWRADPAHSPRAAAAARRRAGSGQIAFVPSRSRRRHRWRVCPFRAPRAARPRSGSHGKRRRLSATISGRSAKTWLRPRPRSCFWRPARCPRSTT